MKRFLTSYLHCHGMLFSRVGLDGFRESCTRMLREFRALLLSGSPTSTTLGPVPSRLSTQLLLQIMAVNMYAVANTEVKGECFAFVLQTATSLLHISRDENVPAEIDLCFLSHKPECKKE